MRDLIEPLSSSDLLARAIQSFDELLPEGWETSLASANIDPYADRRGAPDALLEVDAPDGNAIAFAIGAKLTITGRDLSSSLTSLQNWSELNDALPLVVSRYLSSTVREQLEAKNVSFIDACGNINISSSTPAIVVSRPGLDRDPWRRSTMRDSLRGEPAARISRTLCDYASPIQISELIELSGASAGATYRVIDLLLDEGLAEKGSRGWIESVNVAGLLRRWAVDWTAAESRYTLHFESDDGLEATLRRLAKQPKDSYVLGGAQAAALSADLRKPTTALIHCDDVSELIAKLHARPAAKSHSADLIVHGRSLAAAAAGSSVVDRLVHAAPSQAYADLVLTDDSPSAAALLKALA